MNAISEISAILGSSFSDRLEPIFSVFEKEAQKCAEIALKVFKSPLIWSLGTCGVVYTLLPLPFFIGFISIVGFVLIQKPTSIPKSLLYELAVVYSLAKERLTDLGLLKAPYFTQLEDKIYLGALPLKTMNHHKKMNLLEMSAVLSILEEFEMQTSTFFSEPVSKNDWETLSIQHFLIPAEDLAPLTIDQLDQVADLIALHKEKGVLIHCKAGMGRSVTGYLAYKIKHEKMSYEEAYCFIKQKRPSINLQEGQTNMLKVFEKRQNAYSKAI